MQQPTFQPTGIEAAVCEDIARRQQLGIHKYGRTVADNPLALGQWLQHLYEELLDAAVYVKRAMAELTATGRQHAQPKAAKEPKPAREPARHAFNGQQLTARELAEAAQCSLTCMRERLRRMPAERAVQMGPPGEQGVKFRGLREATAERMRKARRWEYKGQQLTARELGALCGISTHQMTLRLRNNTPEQAVAMGGIGRKGPGRAKAPAAPITRTLPQDAEVIVPANVKRTIAPPIPERFASTGAPRHFSGRIRRYDADAGDTLMARAGGARG